MTMYFFINDVCNVMLVLQRLDISGRYVRFGDRLDSFKERYLKEYE